ncbi:hypothetical protein ACFST9_01290 [Hymenobacter monticola]|uniref:DUF3298 domain-containing protein n=1 Tax=Hymenobacter monticola TaxID=1705399 RepID=A0ABY4B2P8_9BACT|nr:hypothetical protein [Hymenobacter monticola]UOE33402.1 hypothetical protein MTP16_20040 [Hymenobacter monticola]
MVHECRPLRLASGLLLLAVLSGCQPDPPKEQPAQASKPPPPPFTERPPAAWATAQLPPYTIERQAAMEAEAAAADTLGCVPQPMRFSALATGPVFRRYTGIIDQARVTVELGWTRPDSITGRFYRWRGGPEYALGAVDQPSKPLVLPVLESFNGVGAGTWRLARVPTSVLAGVWVDTSGHRHPFQLRENYTGAVPYEIQVLKQTGGKPNSDEPHDCRVPFLRQEYLHLRGVAGRRPALRRLQPPPLAVRRRHLRAAYEFSRTECGVVVRLNGFNLLSYEATYQDDQFGGNRPLTSVKSFLVDLATGQPLTIASQLRPDYERPLRQLLTEQLLKDYGPDEDWKWQQPDRAPADQLADLPRPEDEPLTDEELLLTGEGLEATYSKYSVYANPGPVPPAYVRIPYRALRPLVRPGTPLARMLAARGLW